MRHDDREWVLTSAEPEDAAVMRQLARSAYRQYVDRIGQEPAPMTSDYESIATSGQVVLAWHETLLVGMLVMCLEETILLVENVAVAPEMQGSGLGSALLAEAERVASREGKSEVRLYTNEAMVENLSFYPHRGYIETHRRTEDGYRRVYFSKQLNL